MNAVEKNLGVAVRELRMATPSMTQREFAERIGINGGSQAISKYESGGNVGIRALAQMAILALAKGRADLAELFDVVLVQKTHGTFSGTIPGSSTFSPAEVAFPREYGLLQSVLTSGDTKRSKLLVGLLEVLAENGGAAYGYVDTDGGPRPGSHRRGIEETIEAEISEAEEIAQEAKQHDQQLRKTPKRKRG